MNGLPILSFGLAAPYRLSLAFYSSIYTGLDTAGFSPYSLEQEVVFDLFFRGRKLKDLKRIKAARFDSVRVNREIVLSYATLTLFILSIVACVVSFGFAPADAHKSHVMAILYGSLTGIPLLIFEFAWLVTSTRVDEMLKYRRSIKRRGRRLC